MAYSVAVFDLDGTLLNTLDDLKNSVNYALAQMGFPVRSLGEVRAFVGNGVGLLIERAVPPGTDAAKTARCLEIFKAHYADHMEDLTRPYDGILDMLAELKRRGVVVAVVSNKFDTAVKTLCEKYFPGLVDVAAGESETVQRKPAPDAVYAALERCGGKAEVAVYIGDSDVDVLTAQNAGLPFVGVSWGFREPALLRELGAKDVVDDPAELLAYF